MEESEKRKERLKAMRMEAAQAGADAVSSSSELASGCLSNPLVEGSSPAPAQYASRFDYYTDPMAAFSGSRRNNTSPQVLQGHYNPPPRPMYQGMPPRPDYHSPVANAPGQRIFQAPGAHFNQSPFETSSHRPFGNPPTTQRGSSGGPLNYSNPPPNLLRDGPRGNFSYPSIGLGNSPNVGYDPRGRSSGGAFNYSSTPPPDSLRDGNFSNAGLGQANSPYVSYGRGRAGGQRSNNYSHFHSGRSRGSGFGGSRGSGSHESVNAEQRPDLYYRKEMLEDPWKTLPPIILKDAQARDSDKSWLPKSVSMKKAKVSGEASSHTAIPQQSLAEYLAASFDDSTTEAINNEGRSEESGADENISVVMGT